jgi:glycosyltransferase involved in cell wall biosynthesis
LDPTKSLLLVLTDGSFFEHADWFGSGYDRFDLAAILQQIEKPHHVQLLVDLVRGLRPEMIFNVNSRLAWDLTTSYGKQLASETKLFAYLFTWDLDELGTKGGYPIEYFELGFDHLTRVLIDNATLKNELSSRYVMSGKLQDKLRVLYTPIANAQSNHSENFSIRRAAGLPLRCFWSGRFDRQKRFDLVIEIARRRPDLEISAWGKSVLGDPSLDMESLPSNIKLMGTYRDFDELPIQSFDFFLYTSEWDGMPTILMDCGSRGVPVLASRVGGVGEIIDESTGWPIDDALNPEAYVEGIEKMVNNPSEVSRRAAALHSRVKTMFSNQQYRDGLASAMREGPK